MIIPKEIESDIKLFRFFYKSDLRITLYFLSFIFVFKSLINDKYQIPYYIFYLVLLLILLVPSSSNEGKKNYYALERALTIDRSSYVSIPNPEESNDV